MAAVVDRPLRTMYFRTLMLRGSLPSNLLTRILTTPPVTSTSRLRFPPMLFQSSLSSAQGPHSSASGVESRLQRSSTEAATINNVANQERGNSDIPTPPSTPVICFNRSPVSIGLHVIHGYHEMITPQTDLPCKRRGLLEKITGPPGEHIFRLLGRGANAPPLQDLSKYQTLCVQELRKEGKLDGWHLTSVSIQLETTLQGSVTFFASYSNHEITRRFDANTIPEKGDLTQLQPIAPNDSGDFLRLTLF